MLGKFQENENLRIALEASLSPKQKLEKKSKNAFDSWENTRFKTPSPERDAYMKAHNALVSYNLSQINTVFLMFRNDLGRRCQRMKSQCQTVARLSKRCSKITNRVFVSATSLGND